MEHPQISGGIVLGVKYGKVAVQSIKAVIIVISLKLHKIKLKLLFTAYIKSYTSYRSESKCMTLSDL